MDLSTLVVGNAAGTVKTVEGVRRLEKSAVTRITVGSITEGARAGNYGDTYYFDIATHTSVNSIGLKNPGIEWYHNGNLNHMVEIAHGVEKELWASVAGFSIDGYVDLARACFSCGVDGVELNLGCPNVHDEGKDDLILSYHPELVEELLDKMNGEFFSEGRKFGAKISPVPSSRDKEKNEEDVLTQLAYVINTSGIISEVVAVNTLPQQRMMKDDGEFALSYTPPGGTELMHLGGLAGAGLKAHGLRVIRKLRNPDNAKGTLYRNIRLIAAGGIFSGADALEYLELGANGFELGTAYYNHENPAVFSAVLNELVGLLEPA